ncbi:MAG TPA: FAD-dependent oxidoreductase [Candidatus Binatia bacterium]|nr:FAD-dependent oxidoreductase [Candidatus Binatia bacterium]
MARTQLFSKIKRALKYAAYLEAKGISTTEGLEQIAETHWSRRRFLQTTAAATAGAAFNVVVPRLPVLGVRRPRVVIVGAGCAGLTCAYRLQQVGIQACVLEASTRVGGRMLTLRHTFPDEQITELGGEFIDTGHKALRRLARELGLALVDVHKADDGLLSDVYYFDNRSVPYAEIVESFRPAAALIEKDLSTLTGDGSVTYKNPNNGQELDNLSIAEWLDTRGVTGVIRSLLEVAYRGEYGLEVDEQSSLNLLLLIGTDPDNFEIFGDSDERFHIAKGNDSVPTRLANRLKRPIELGTRLDAIRQLANGTYLLTINQVGTVKDIEADEVVLTLPFTLLREVEIGVLLPPVKQLAIDTLGYGTNAKVIAGFSQRTWQVAGSNGSTFSDLSYQSSWDTTRGQAGLHGILTNFVGGERGVAVGDGTPEEQAADFVAQINTVFPGAASAYTGQAVRAHWPTAPFVKGSYTCYRPGQYTTIAGAEMEPVGSLHFAGEHTSLHSQGFMNGACESGERAAKEVLLRVLGKWGL